MIIGKYVQRFKDADIAMLDGVSLNAPYEFHWLFITSVTPETIVCRTRENGGREITLKYFACGARDLAEVTVEDPIFGPMKVTVIPFKRNEG